jgi:SNF2 family DNA or RNA helicase
LPHGAARVNKLLQIVSGFMIVGPDSTICDACPSMERCVENRIKPYTKSCVVVQTPPPRQIIRDVENPKLEMFEQLLSNILESDDTNKVLCWGSYLPELDDMEAVCRKLKVGHVRVDGDSTKHIKEIEDKFAEDPDCRVYVGQVRSGVGINLTSANYAVYYSLPWDQVQYHQSLERNNRPGQVRAMTVYRLIGDDTIQEFVAQVLAHKDHIAYTLVEKIACAQCDQQARCGPENIRPFRQGCKYQSEAVRPIAKVGVIR